MKHISLTSKSLATIMSDLGGLWRFTTSVTFLLLSSFMTQLLLTSQARVIKDRKLDQSIEPTLQEELAQEQEKEIVARLKHRLSYVQLY